MDDITRVVSRFVESRLDRHLDRVDYRYLPRMPVLLVEGPRGSGKTALLSALEAEWCGRAPVRRIGFADVDDGVAPYLVASAVGDALRGTIPPPGSAAGKPPRTVPARLHRITLGLAAMEPSSIGRLARGDRDLEQYLATRDKVVPAVTALVDEARDQLTALPVPAPGARMALKGVPPLVWAVRKRMRSYRWFAEATGADTPIRGLVTLNHAKADGNTAAVDGVLMRAFLADLRESYRRWATQRRFPSNIVLLLDDIDRHAGRAFVSSLLSVRSEGADGDPLIVVATTGCAAEGLLAPHAVTRGLVDTGGPVRVVELGGSDAEPGPGHAPRVIRAVTGGHRWSEQRLLRAFAARPPAMHAASLLTPELVEETVDRVLTDCGDDLRADLSAAAAVDPCSLATPMLRTVLTNPIEPNETVRYQKATASADAVRTFLSERLWTPRGPEPGMHPLLRTILLRRLATAGHGHRSWTSVFGRLRDEQAGGELPSPTWLYYQLARTGNVSDVADALLRRLEDANTRAGWLAALDIVATAPLRQANDGTDYRERARAVIGAAAPPDAAPRTQLRHRLASIVGELWLSASLSADSDLAEYLHVAAELDQLASTWRDPNGGDPLPPALREQLYDRAETYRHHHHVGRFFVPPHDHQEHE